MLAANVEQQVQDALGDLNQIDSLLINDDARVKLNIIIKDLTIAINSNDVHAIKKHVVKLRRFRKDIERYVHAVRFVVEYTLASGCDPATHKGLPLWAEMLVQLRKFDKVVDQLQAICAPTLTKREPGTVDVSTQTTTGPPTVGPALTP